MEATTQFSTAPLLRPDQVETARDEIKSLEDKLLNPLIQDKGQVRKQLQQAQKLTAQQTPQPPANGEEEGRMVARSKDLLEKILTGMPSQEEMRKAPPGAVEKHRAWERRNKPAILEWKNLQLRLNAGTSDRDVANLEKHRPTGSSLNMDNAFITGKQFHMPEMTGPAVTFTDAHLAVLRQLSPQIADSIALMGNADRQQVKDTISGIGLAQPSEAQIEGRRGFERREARRKPAKRQLSAEHKAKLAAGRARKAAERAAEKAE